MQCYVRSVLKHTAVLLCVRKRADEDVHIQNASAHTLPSHSKYPSYVYVLMPMCQVHFSSAAGGKRTIVPPTFLWHSTALCMTDNRDTNCIWIMQAFSVHCDANSKVMVERHMDGRSPTSAQTPAWLNRLKWGFNGSYFYHIFKALQVSTMIYSNNGTNGKCWSRMWDYSNFGWTQRSETVWGDCSLDNSPIFTFSFLSVLI